jgi:hypothetical protein
MALLWRFLLILAPERANWGVAPNPAKVGLGVRKCPLNKLRTLSNCEVIKKA